MRGPAAAYALPLQIIQYYYLCGVLYFFYLFGSLQIGFTYEIRNSYSSVVCFILCSVYS